LDGAVRVKIDRGTLLLVDLDPTAGQEQRGLRPCVVVSDPDVVADQRFPLIGVVPVTRTPGTGALYPPLLPGPSGLTSTSYALVDHVRSVDKRRVRRVYSRIAPDEMTATSEGLKLFFGLVGSDETDVEVP
jgi:mRNA interferase MazF